MKHFLNTTIDNIRTGNYKELKKALYVGLLVVVLGLAGNIIFTLLTTDRSLFTSLQHFKSYYLIIAVVLALVPWVTNTLRMMIWTRFLGRSFSFASLWRITISVELGSALSPTAIGGGYVKAALLMQRGLNIGQATSLLTLGSIENALFFLLALPLAVYHSRCWDLPIIQQIAGRFKQNILTVLIIVLIAITIILIIRFLRRRKNIAPRTDRVWGRLQHKIKEAINDFLAVYKLIGQNGKSRFALSMALTAVQWISRYSILTTMLLSFDIHVNPVLVFLLQWVTFTLMTFIPTPGASAGAEASFFLVYSSLIPKEYLGLVTAGWRFLTFYFTILAGLLILSLFLLANVTLQQRKQSGAVTCQP